MNKPLNIGDTLRYKDEPHPYIIKAFLDKGKRVVLSMVDQEDETYGRRIVEEIMNDIEWTYTPITQYSFNDELFTI